MPVEFHVKKEYLDPWTNEVLTGKVPTNRVAYEIASKNTIYVMRPVVDTLTATFNVNKAWDHYSSLTPTPSGASATLAAYLNQMFNRVHEIHDLKKWPTKYKRVKRYGNGYRYNLALHKHKLDSAPVLNFKAVPPSKGTTFRMEFSASALNSPTADLIRERWATIDGGLIPFPALLESAKITRVDIAVDIVNMRVSDIVPYHPKVQTVWTAQTHLAPIETLLLYTGNKKKSHQSYKKRANLKIYDKKNELEHKKKDPPYGELPHTRIEFGHVQGPKIKNLFKWTPKMLPEWTFFHHPYSAVDPRALAQRMDSLRARGLRHVTGTRTSAPEVTQTLKEHYPDDLIQPEIYSLIHEALRAGTLGTLIEWANLPMQQAFELFGKKAAT